MRTDTNGNASHETLKTSRSTHKDSRTDLQGFEISALCKDCTLYFTELDCSLEDTSSEDAFKIGYDRESSISTIKEERTRFRVWTSTEWELTSLMLREQGDLGVQVSEVAQRARRILQDLYESLHKGQLTYRCILRPNN